MSDHRERSEKYESTRGFHRRIFLFLCYIQINWPITVETGRGDTGCSQIEFHWVETVHEAKGWGMRAFDTQRIVRSRLVKPLKDNTGHRADQATLEELQETAGTVWYWHLWILELDDTSRHLPAGLCVCSLHFLKSSSPRIGGSSSFSLFSFSQYHHFPISPFSQRVALLSLPQAVSPTPNCLNDIFISVIEWSRT